MQKKHRNSIRKDCIMHVNGAEYNIHLFLWLD